MHYVGLAHAALSAASSVASVLPNRSRTACAHRACSHGTGASRAHQSRHPAQIPPRLVWVAITASAQASSSRTSGIVVSAPTVTERFGSPRRIRVSLSIGVARPRSGETVQRRAAPPRRSATLIPVPLDTPPRTSRVCPVAGRRSGAARSALALGGAAAAPSRTPLMPARDRCRGWERRMPGTGRGRSTCTAAPALSVRVRSDHRQSTLPSVHLPGGGRAPLQQHGNPRPTARASLSPVTTAIDATRCSGGH